MKALNDTTLQVTLTQPNAAFTAMLAHPSLVPIDKVLVERYADKWTRPEHIVTSGPYKLSQWVVNERLVAERNAKYWDNAHTVINKVTYLPISSEAADVNRYKAGEIDIVYTVPINQFAQLQKTMGDQLDVSPQLATYYYEFNTTRPPFNDARVRRALNMALDKDIIAGKVLGQGQRPARLIGQPDIGGVTLHNPDYASWPREKRIAEAKNCWRRRGMMKAIRWSLPCSITPLSRTSVSPLPPALCGRKPRRRGEATEPEWKTMLDTMHTHNFDAVRYAWIADYDDAATFLNTFRTGDSENTSQYSNPAYDEALRNAAKASDVATRGKYYQQAEDLLAQDVPAIPVYHYVRTHLVKPWVGASRRISWGITTPKTCTLKHPSASGDGR
nr:Periplasmic oligopeptide-binding protein precursor [Klebsiella pneumoniae]